MKPTAAPIQTERNPYASSQADSRTWLFDYGTRIPRRYVVVSHLSLIGIYGIAGTLCMLLLSLVVQVDNSSPPIVTGADVWNWFKIFIFIGTMLSTLGVVFSLVVNGRGGLKPHVGALFLLFLGTTAFVVFCILSPAGQQDTFFGFGPRTSVFLTVGLVFWTPWLITCCVYLVMAGWTINRTRPHTPIV